MSEKLKPCRYCEKHPEMNSRRTLVWCVSSRDECPFGHLAMSPEEWNTRPIEDTLRAELARKDELIERLDALVEAFDVRQHVEGNHDDYSSENAYAMDWIKANEDVESARARVAELREGVTS